MEYKKKSLFHTLKNCVYALRTPIMMEKKRMKERKSNKYNIWCEKE